MWNAGKHKRKWVETWEIAFLWGFLWHLVTSFQAASYIDRTTHQCWEMFFLHIEAVRNLSTTQYDRGTGCTCVYLHLFWDKLIYTWVYSPVNFNKLSGGKLSLSGKIKTEQVFIVFDWNEDTSIEEEGKVIATRFIINYLWLWREKESIFKSLFCALFSSYPPKRLYWH